VLALQFQSLFWWIEGWDSAAGLGFHLFQMFQSLFWWIEGWDSSDGRRRRSRVFVSILVLVD